MWNPFAKKKAPSVPPYPTSADEAAKIFFAYARDERPMDFFFEFYVMDIIGALRAETVAAIDELAADVVETDDWRQMVREEMHLSETFDVAVLDLWYRNSDELEARGESYHPWEYAADFANQYFADDSLVDVWPDGALEAARARIAERQSA